MSINNFQSVEPNKFITVTASTVEEASQPVYATASGVNISTQPGKAAATESPVMPGVLSKNLRVTT